MADGTAVFRQGENRPVFADLSVPAGGSISITGTPTFTLYRGGSVVTSPLDFTGGVPVTQIQGDGTSDVKILYAFDTTALPPGVYSGVFSIHATPSDGFPRTLESTLEILVQPLNGTVSPGIPFTQPGLDLSLFAVTPSLPAESIANGQTLFWSVSSLIQDASGNVLGESQPCGVQSFFLDAPDLSAQGVAVTVGGATYSALQQAADPLSPVQFQPTGISPALGSVRQDLMNTPQPPLPLVACAFSVPLSAGQESLFRLYRSSLYDYRGQTPVPGSWVLSPTRVLSAKEQPSASGTAMVFQSNEFYLPNTRYTVEVSPSLSAMDGQTLEEPLTFGWTSWYTPFHIAPYRVRQRLGEHSAAISDEDLYYAIWRASVKANREMLWYIPAGYFRGGPSEQEVINFTVFHSMALDGFVELEASIRLLEKLIGRAAEDGGIGESFKESEVHVSPERVKAITAAIKAFRGEWEMYRAELSMKRARPRTAIKSANWNAGIAGRDHSFRPRKGF